jgi:Spy/CpxP family protein refolding chaperone
MDAKEQKHTGRRRLFRLAGIGAALGALGAGFAWRAHAQGHGFRHGPIDPARMEEHIDRMLKHLYVEIDATEEQKAKIAPIVKDAARELAPLRGKMGETRQQAVAILSAPQVDRAALEQLRADKLAMADGVSRRITQALADLADVLSPDQRQHLAKIAARRHRWHG